MIASYEQSVYRKAELSKRLKLCAVEYSRAALSQTFVNNASGVVSSYLDLFTDCHLPSLPSLFVISRSRFA